MFPLYVLAKWVTRIVCLYINTISDIALEGYSSFCYTRVSWAGVELPDSDPVISKEIMAAFEDPKFGALFRKALNKYHI